MSTKTTAPVGLEAALSDLWPRLVAVAAVFALVLSLGVAPPASAESDAPASETTGFERVDALTLQANENNLSVAVVDPTGEFAYFGTNTLPGRVVKVDLENLERVGTIILAPGENALQSVVVDPAGEYAYFGTSAAAGTNPPGRVVKIDLENFERVGAITFESGESRLGAAVVDPAGEYAYFGTRAEVDSVGPPAHVVKVDLENFERVGAITFESGESRLGPAVVDPAGEYAYFGTGTPIGQVVKVDLDTFERVGAITFGVGEDFLQSAVMDPEGEFAYFGNGGTVPGRVVKVDLENFERVEGITLSPGENTLRAAVVDPDGAFAYFGTDTSPGQVVKVDLATFERAGAIELDPGENRLNSAVVDPAGESAYFGTGQSPGRVVKVAIDVPVEALPDLVVSELSDPPGSAAQGTSFVVTETTANVGTAIAAASETHLFLSPSAELELDVVYDSIGSRVVPELAAGEDDEGTMEATVPGDLDDGSYWLVACADAADVVSESDETNNCTTSTSQVNVGEMPGAVDGTVEDGVSGDPVEGAEVELSGPQAASTTTGVDGSYLVDGLVPGSYTVEVSAGGYESASQGDVAVSAGETTTVDFALEQAPEEVCPAGLPLPFDDVNPESVHAASIACAVYREVARGVAEGVYAPSEDVRRGQMATFVAQALEAAGYELPEAEDQGLTDVGGVHADAINRLVAAEVVGGTTSTTFSPSELVRRAQMASFLVGAVRWALDEDLEAEGGPHFADTESNPHAANIDLAFELGLTGGTAEGEFSPAATVRRAPMATFLVNLLDVLWPEPSTTAAGGGGWEPGVN